MHAQWPCWHACVCEAVSFGYTTATAQLLHLGCTVSCLWHCNTRWACHEDHGVRLASGLDPVAAPKRGGAHSSQAQHIPHCGELLEH